MLGYTPEAPFMAAVTNARFLTSPESLDRQVLHMELRLPERAKRSVLYHPGDALGIHCPNDERMVKDLLARLGLSEKAHFDIEIRANQPPCPSPGVAATAQESKSIKSCLCAHIGGQVTISDAFTYCCDITSPPRKVSFYIST